MLVRPSDYTDAGGKAFDVGNLLFYLRNVSTHIERDSRLGLRTKEVG
jgi:hypothetical protein